MYNFVYDVKATKITTFPHNKNVTERERERERERECLQGKPQQEVQNVPRDTAPGKCGLRSPAVKARYMDVEDVAWLLVAENDD